MIVFKSGFVTMLMDCTRVGEVTKALEVMKLHMAMGTTICG